MPEGRDVDGGAAAVEPSRTAQYPLNNRARIARIARDLRAKIATVANRLVAPACVERTRWLAVSTPLPWITVTGRCRAITMAMPADRAEGVPAKGWASNLCLRM